MADRKLAERVLAEAALARQITGWSYRPVTTTIGQAEALAGRFL